MEDSLPLDIESARAFGWWKWRDGFFWPVSYESYSLMEAEVKRAFNRLIDDNAGNGMDELLVAGYKLFLEYSSFVYSLMVLKELEERGVRPLCGSTSVNFKGIIEGGVPLRRRLSVPSAPRAGLGRRLRSGLGRARARARFGGGALDLVFQPSGDTDHITDRSFLGGLALEYVLRELNGKVSLRDSWQWFSRQNGNGLGAELMAKIVLLVDSIVESVRSIALGQGLWLSGPQLAHLRAVAEKTLSATAWCVGALERYLSKQRQRHLIIGSGGNQLARMLSVAVRRNGGTVTGFKHGEPVFHMWDYISWLDLTVADRYVTYTEASAGALENVLVAYPVPGHRAVRCEGMGTNMFYNLWLSESRKPLPRKIERVMLVGKGLENDYRIACGLAFPELMQLDWELRIIEILRKAGYAVTYKAHPSGVLSGQLQDVFGADVDVAFEPLHEVLDRADCFVFYHTITTTLGEALCTNKPVIYIDGGWEPWLPEIFGPFSKRCRVVPAGFDERNRLAIDEERLLDALRREPTAPDTEFASSYMLPEHADI